ncbi:glycosyltransferase [Shewanella livingstonensis]|uniref:Glycosyltransferase n=1 Tax=Shewanella livingstonensis TaxID=150120 RepID=A0A3G8LXP2_9GAMM|nr:glycosyltransferase [Shewanella livingstonensis]AZG74184.1 glycosyltransferase [Shewanella livingstonensis]
MKPTISICCLIFNHEKYLNKSIDSFLSQKGSFNLEIVIFDDCSTDKSRALIGDYVKKFPEVFKLVYPERNIYSEGKTAYYNLISAATGEFIACCEGDDYWIDDFKLQKQLDYLIEFKDVNLVFHPALSLHTNNVIQDDEYGFYGEDITTKSFEDILRCSGGFMPMASIFTRKYLYLEWFNKYPDFFSESMWHSTIQILGAYKSKAVYLPDRMCVYRTMHEGSWSSSITQSSDALITDYKSFIKRNRKLNEIMNFEYKVIYDQVLIKRTEKVIRNRRLTNQQKNELIKLANYKFNWVTKIKFIFFKIISSVIRYVK